MVGKIVTAGLTVVIAGGVSSAILFFGPKLIMSLYALQAMSNVLKFFDTFM